MLARRLFYGRNLEFQESLKLMSHLHISTKNHNSGQRSIIYPRVNYEWPYPADFRKPSKLWKFKSALTILGAGLWGKTIISLMNTTKYRNRQVLTDAIFNRPPGVPLITLANHESCIDDPCLIASAVTVPQLLRQAKMRWALVASDICYRKSWHGWVMGLGKCPPVVRGGGVHQPAVDFAIQRLNEGDWLHLFPEGKVNMERRGLYRLKWGVGRIIADLEQPPLIIPFWHVGIQNIMPNTPPYIPHLGKKLFINVGQPIDVSGLLKSIEESKASEKRKIITDYIQGKMEALRLETLALAELQGITTISDYPDRDGVEEEEDKKQNGLI